MSLIQGANWQGQKKYATEKQLLSTSAGLYDDLKDFNFSTIQVSTLNVPLWISTPILYVSDLQGFSIDISGVQITQDGVIGAPVVSLSSLSFKGFDNLLDLDVSFDLGLGDALGGLLGGLGALVGGATIAVGTGAGLAVSGAAQGIATLVAGRPENYINSNVYETINFTTQLQVSTIGDAFPLYSTIYRTVSSTAPDQQPGPEIFLSTFFLPGQICIRAVSDPFNLITGNSNLNTSTLQSFGQWTALQGLEPDNIQADSISTNKLQVMDSMYANFAAFDTQTSYAILASNTLQVGLPNNPANLVLPYESAVQFEIASGNYARQVGDVGAWYFQSDGDLVFSKPGDPNTIPIAARLQLGDNANESILTVSSINALGNINAESAFVSSMTVFNLLVISSFSTVQTINAVETLSTFEVTADFIGANYGQISSLQVSSMQPFQFKGVLGNSNGPFDITRYDSLFSTSYVGVSSLTQNILNYSLNLQVQDEASFDLGDPPLGVWYKVTPANVQQWASTTLIFTGTQDPGLIDLGWRGQWGVTPGEETNPLKSLALSGATFDVIASNAPGYSSRALSITESSNNAYPFGVSTLVQTADGQGTTFYRFTLPPATFGSNNGWWQYQVGFTPYSSSNNNTFSITQDINDTFITATDRLHLVAGDIFADGVLNLQTLNIENLQTQFIDCESVSTVNASIGILNATAISTNQILVNPATGGIDSFFYKPSTIGYLGNPQTITPLQMTFNVQSADVIPQYVLVSPFMGSNQFTSYNQTSWNGTLWNNQTAFILGPPKIYLGDVQTTRGSYAAKFWINNDYPVSGGNYALPIYTINTSGSNLLGIIPGGNYGLIQTTDGQSWTLNSNVPNPQNVVGGNFSNIVTVSQNIQQTTIDNTQNLQINAPNTAFVTGSMNLYADQIRVNSRRYGSLETATIPSFPIGIENTVYIDANMAFTYNAGPAVWESDAANILYNINNSIFYDANSWIVQVIPSRFRVDDARICGWDVQPAIFAVGSGGYAWGYNRYIVVETDPGDEANNWNWVIAFPKNYCTYE